MKALAYLICFSYVMHYAQLAANPTQNNLKQQLGNLSLHFLKSTENLLVPVCSTIGAMGSYLYTKNKNDALLKGATLYALMTYIKTAIRGGKNKQQVTAFKSKSKQITKLFFIFEQIKKNYLFGIKSLNYYQSHPESIPSIPYREASPEDLVDALEFASEFPKLLRLFSSQCHLVHSIKEKIKNQASALVIQELKEQFIINGTKIAFEYEATLKYSFQILSNYYQKDY